MPVLRPSGSDFTSFVKAAAQYVAPGRSAKASKSGGVPVALPGLGALVRASQVGALASPTTSAVVINGITPLAAVAAVAVAVIRVLLGIVTTLAGSSQGFADGTGAGASFNYPFGVALLSNGNIVVADTFNNRIRLVNPTSGVVTTLAGSGSPAFADGTGTGASFYYPLSVAVLSNGIIVVADTFNNRIRLVNPTSGIVTTLAGSSNYDFADGTGTGASFKRPGAVAVTSTDVIVVSDSDNHRIRLVTYPAGVVTTLAGSGNYDFVNGTGTGASFRLPRGLAVTSAGDIIVADAENNRIRLVTLAGVVTTLAGSGSPGSTDGTGTGASFASPTGVAVTSSGMLVVSEQGNHRIRLMTYPGGVVTTLAGSGSPAFADGTGVAASFNQPFGVAVTSSGVIVVADHYNHRIRLIV
jgi:sugar lactone lactonase YvrE